MEYEIIKSRKNYYYYYRFIFDIVIKKKKSSMRDVNLVQHITRIFGWKVSHPVEVEIKIKIEREIHAFRPQVASLNLAWTDTVI